MVAFAVALVAGCGHDGRHAPPLGGREQGNALSAPGLRSAGTFTFLDPRAGHTYYLGFPPLTNRSSSPVHITGFRLSGVSANIRVLGYVGHSASQFGGRTVIAYDPAAPPPKLHFETTPLLTLRYDIPPKSESLRFAMARVRLLRYPPTGSVAGCQVLYTLGVAATRYVQQFPCPVHFGQPTPTGAPGTAVVDVVNSTGRRILIEGCPICKGRGAGLPGDPESTHRDGPYLGWEVKMPDPLTYTVVLADGGHVVCRPMAPGGSLGDGAYVKYNVTAAGRCEVIQLSPGA
jgi:hypothetical protein